MRTTAYTCDRCGQPVNPRSVTKMNMNIQRGMNPVDKEAFDFCANCFLKMKKGFKQLMKPNGELAVETKAKPSCEKDMPPKPPADTGRKEPVKEKPIQEKPIQEKPVQDEKPAVAIIPVIKESVMAAVDNPVKQDSAAADSPAKEYKKRGPASWEEKERIWKLSGEGLAADVIAARVSRRPNFVQRIINEKPQPAEPESRPMPEEPEVEEDYSGSGATDSGITKDSYTAPPQKEVVDGKRYDVGGILALANAGWSTDKIAEERHYDEDVVRMLLDKYL